MENLTAVDGGAALIVLVSAILAFSRGLVRELMAIIGWVGAAIAAYYFAPGVQPLVKELPVVGEFLSESCELSVVAAFAGVFVIGLIVAALFTPLFSGAVQRSAIARSRPSVASRTVGSRRASKQVLTTMRADLP